MYKEPSQHELAISSLAPEIYREMLGEDGADLAKEKENFIRQFAVYAEYATKSNSDSLSQNLLEEMLWDVPGKNYQEKFNQLSPNEKSQFAVLAHYALHKLDPEKQREKLPGGISLEECAAAALRDIGKLSVGSQVALLMAFGEKALGNKLTYASVAKKRESIPYFRNSLTTLLRNDEDLEEQREQLTKMFAAYVKQYPSQKFLEEMFGDVLGGTYQEKFNQLSPNEKSRFAVLAHYALHKLDPEKQREKLPGGISLEECAAAALRDIGKLSVGSQVTLLMTFGEEALKGKLTYASVAKKRESTQYFQNFLTTLMRDDEYLGEQREHLEKMFAAYTKHYPNNDLLKRVLLGDGYEARPDSSGDEFSELMQQWHQSHAESERSKKKFDDLSPDKKARFAILAHYILNGLDTEKQKEKMPGGISLQECITEALRYIKKLSVDSQNELLQTFGEEALQGYVAGALRAIEESRFDGYLQPLDEGAFKGEITRTSVAEKRRSIEVLNSLTTLLRNDEDLAGQRQDFIGMLANYNKAEPDKNFLEEMLPGKTEDGYKTRFARLLPNEKARFALLVRHVFPELPLNEKTDKLPDGISLQECAAKVAQDIGKLSIDNQKAFLKEFGGILGLDSKSVKAAQDALHSLTKLVGNNEDLAGQKRKIVAMFADYAKVFPTKNLLEEMLPGKTEDGYKTRFARLLPNEKARFAILANYALGQLEVKEQRKKLSDGISLQECAAKVAQDIGKLSIDNQKAFLKEFSGVLGFDYESVKAAQYALYSLTKLVVNNEDLAGQKENIVEMFKNYAKVFPDKNLLEEMLPGEAEDVYKRRFHDLSPDQKSRFAILAKYVFGRSTRVEEQGKKLPDDLSFQECITEVAQNIEKLSIDNQVAFLKEFGPRAGYDYESVKAARDAPPSLTKLVVNNEDLAGQKGKIVAMFADYAKVFPKKNLLEEMLPGKTEDGYKTRFARLLPNEKARFAILANYALGQLEVKEQRKKLPGGISLQECVEEVAQDIGKLSIDNQKAFLKEFGGMLGFNYESVKAAQDALHSITKLVVNNEDLAGQKRKIVAMFADYAKVFPEKNLLEEMLPGEIGDNYDTRFKDLSPDKKARFALLANYALGELTVEQQRKKLPGGRSLEDCAAAALIDIGKLSVGSQVALLMAFGEKALENKPTYASVAEKLTPTSWWRGGVALDNAGAQLAKLASGYCKVETENVPVENVALGVFGGYSPEKAEEVVSNKVFVFIMPHVKKLSYKERYNFLNSLSLGGQEAIPSNLFLKLATEVTKSYNGSWFKGVDSTKINQVSGKVEEVVLDYLKDPQQKDSTDITNYLDSLSCKEQYSLLSSLRNKLGNDKNSSNTFLKLAKRAKENYGIGFFAWFSGNLPSSKDMVSLNEFFKQNASQASRAAQAKIHADGIAAASHRFSSSQVPAINQDESQNLRQSQDGSNYDEDPLDPPPRYGPSSGSL